MAGSKIGKKGIITVLIVGAVIAMGVVLFLPKLKEYFGGDEKKSDLPAAESIMQQEKNKSTAESSTGAGNQNTDSINPAAPGGAEQENKGPNPLGPEEMKNADGNPQGNLYTKSNPNFNAGAGYPQNQYSQSEQYASAGQTPPSGYYTSAGQNAPSGYYTYGKSGQGASDYEFYLGKIQGLKTQLLELEQQLEKSVVQQKSSNQAKLIVLEGNKATVVDPYYYPGSIPQKSSNVQGASGSKYTKKKTSGAKKSQSYSNLKLQIKNLKARIVKLEKRVDQLEKE